MKKKLLLIMTIGYFHTTKNKQTDFEPVNVEGILFVNDKFILFTQ